MKYSVEFNNIELSRISLINHLRWSAKEIGLSSRVEQDSHRGHNGYFYFDGVSIWFEGRWPLSRPFFVTINPEDFVDHFQIYDCGCKESKIRKYLDTFSRNFASLSGCRVSKVA